MHVSVVPRDVSEPMTAAQWQLVRRDYPDAYVQRVRIAMRLALDVATCGALLEGRPVDPSRLDQAELARARKATLVQLVAPIDVLDPVLAAA
jgi:hypothetical protein